MMKNTIFAGCFLIVMSCFFLPNTIHACEQEEEPFEFVDRMALTKEMKNASIQRGDASLADTRYAIEINNTGTKDVLLYSRMGCANEWEVLRPGESRLYVNRYISAKNPFYKIELRTQAYFFWTRGAEAEVSIYRQRSIYSVENARRWTTNKKFYDLQWIQHQAN